LIAVVALTAAGCGSSKPKENPTTQWANSLCTSATTWEDSITAAANSVKSGGFSQSSLRKASNDIQDATKTLVSDVKKLGRPPTKAGAQEQQAIDNLQNEINDGVTKIQDATSNASGAAGALNAVSTVTATIATIGDEIKATYKDLQSIDKTGELQTAFNQADACKKFTKSAGS
jgi:hypothetical protein